MRLDLATWNQSAKVANYSRWMKKSPTSIGIRMSFTDSDGVATPLSDGVGCAIGQSCSFGLEKHQVKLLGDNSGSNKWGDCQTDAPYSINHCQTSCVRQFATDVCSSTLTPREYNLCAANAFYAACNRTLDSVVECPSDTCACYSRCDDVTWTVAASAVSNTPMPGFLRLKQASEEMQDWLYEQYLRTQRTGDGEIVMVNKSGDVVIMACVAFKNCTYDELTTYTQQNIVELVVYVQSLSHTVLEETVAVPFSSLTATVGGNMGLCMGISVMTFFEWFEWIVVALFSYTCLSHAPCGRQGAKEDDHVDENNPEMGKSNADRSPKHKVGQTHNLVPEANPIATVPEMGHTQKVDDHIENL